MDENEILSLVAAPHTDASANQLQSIESSYDTSPSHQRRQQYQNPEVYHQQAGAGQTQFQQCNSQQQQISQPTGLLSPSSAYVSSQSSANNFCPEVKLEDADLWQAFNSQTNEMIVTKSGRRMFPVIKVAISNLDPGGLYTVAIEFVQMESHRWKYVNGEWAPGGKSEPSSSKSLYVHPESPHYGSHWLKDYVTFSKAKLTNKPTNQQGQVVLNSLHKYQPKIHIIRKSERKIYTFSFPETQFIAVTAYQNESVSLSSPIIPKRESASHLESDDRELRQSD